jgi:hypothetical protein
VRANRSVFEADDGTKTTYYSDGTHYQTPFNTMEESVAWGDFSALNIVAKMMGKKM